jgi:CRISPR/Cas system-associated exonuclease Cas4 (RecB family)
LKHRLYDPKSRKAFPISRTKIDLYAKCPRCFWLHVRKGVKRPDGWPLTLNLAVDALLKNEHDGFRKVGAPTLLMMRYGVKAVPFDHPKLKEWRRNFGGIVHLHQPTNLLVSGVIDDVWVNEAGELHVVDYKATSKNEPAEDSSGLHPAFLRQIEVYQWLFRRNGFRVSGIGYFVQANALKDRPNFSARLEFDMKIIPHEGSDAWVEPILIDMKVNLDAPRPAKAASDCQWCRYRREAAAVDK